MNTPLATGLIPPAPLVTVCEKVSLQVHVTVSLTLTVKENKEGLVAKAHGTFHVVESAIAA